MCFLSIVIYVYIYDLICVQEGESDNPGAREGGAETERPGAGSEETG
jgi:hypothetical protein